MSITRRKKQHINQNGVVGYIAGHRLSKKTKIILFTLLFAFLGFSWVFFARAQQVISVPGRQTTRRLVQQSASVCGRKYATERLLSDRKQHPHAGKARNCCKWQ
jgi:hypothetical protein